VLVPPKYRLVTALVEVAGVVEGIVVVVEDVVGVVVAVDEVLEGVLVVVGVVDLVELLETGGEVVATTIAGQEAWPIKVSAELLPSYR
jgi:hypothetical protein